MLILLRYSLNQYVPGGLMKRTVTLANYAQFATNPYYERILLTTVEVAVICTVASLILAFPVAYFLARMRSRIKSVLFILVVFPLLVGNVVRAAGWTAFLGDNGLLNGALERLHLIAEPIQIMHTPMAVMIGITAVVTPYMILTLQSVLERIDASVEEAAANLGASPLTTFMRVTLPLSMPGVIAGTSLVFILCMNAYATPLLLGGARFKMMAQAVYDHIEQSQNWPLGAALAFVLVIVTLAMTALSQRLLGSPAQRR
ncbi:MAG: ABC transporter permease [bacterium]|nr:ABC transporter permease [bacterium]